MNPLFPCDHGAATHSCIMHDPGRGTLCKNVGGGKGSRRLLGRGLIVCVYRYGIRGMWYVSEAPLIGQPLNF